LLKKKGSTTLFLRPSSNSAWILKFELRNENGFIIYQKMVILDSLQKKWETHQHCRSGEPEGSIVGEDGMLTDFLAFDLQCQIM